MNAVKANPQRWWALTVLAMAQFMVIMDTSIIGVALPEIQTAVGFSQASLSWVFNAYVIALGGLLLLGGRLSDLFGARRIFILGFAILTGGSLLAGLADSSNVLLAGRVVQGIGSALIAPAALTLLISLFGHDGRELGKALAIFGAAAPAGGTAGVFLGGVITEWIDWRWVFLVNVPMGLAVLAASNRLLPRFSGRSGSIDVAGAITVTAALSLGVFGIVRAPEEGWTATATLTALAVAGALFVAFLLLQSLKREPLMPLRIFRIPNLAPANLVMALLGAAWVPMWFFLNLYLQQVLGYGAFEGGAALLPMTVMIMVLMVGGTSRVVTRIGLKTTLVGGLILVASGLGLLTFVRPEGTFLADVLPATLVAAAGMSFAYIPAMLASISSAPPEDGGLASGIVNTTYQVGSAFGLAIMTALASAAGADQLGSPIDLTNGFQAAFTGAGIVAVAAAAVALLWIRQSDSVPGTVEVERPAAA